MGICLMCVEPILDPTIISLEGAYDLHVGSDILLVLDALLLSLSSKWMADPYFRWLIKTH